MILSNQAEDLEGIEELEPIEEEEIVEDDSDNTGDVDDNGDNDNDNGNNNGNDNDNGDEPEPPIELPVEGGVEIRLDVDEDQKEIITEGCADGLGYYADRPFLCYPIKDNGELQTEQKGASCAALGCPFNPPDLPYCRVSKIMVAAIVIVVEEEDG